jgi:hypothetical protein
MTFDDCPPEQLFVQAMKREGAKEVNASHG